MTFSEDEHVKIIYKSRYTTILTVTMPTKEPTNLKVEAKSEVTKQLDSFLNQNDYSKMESWKTIEKWKTKHRNEM